MNHPGHNSFRRRRALCSRLLELFAPPRASDPGEGHVLTTLISSDAQVAMQAIKTTRCAESLRALASNLSHAAQPPLETTAALLLSTLACGALFSACSQPPTIPVLEQQKALEAKPIALSEPEQDEGRAGDVHRAPSKTATLAPEVGPAARKAPGSCSVTDTEEGGHRVEAAVLGLEFILPPGKWDIDCSRQQLAVSVTEGFKMMVGGTRVRSSDSLRNTAVSAAVGVRQGMSEDWPNLTTSAPMLRSRSGAERQIACISGEATVVTRPRQLYACASVSGTDSEMLIVFATAITEESAPHHSTSMHAVMKSKMQTISEQWRILR